MAKELLKRSEVKLENTWKTEDMYATVADWEADLARLSELSEALVALDGQLSESADNFWQALVLEDEMRRIAGLAYSYASRCSDVDTTNTENQARVMKIQSLLVSLGAIIQHCCLDQTFAISHNI